MADITAQEELKKKRIKLQIGLNTVQNALHVSASSISRWERGMRCMPNFEGLYRQFLKDCEAGKIQYEKSSRAGLVFHPAPKPYYHGDKQLSLPLQEETSVKINHPVHYSGNIEVIDFIDAHNLNFNLSNVVKYVSRAGRKDGEDTLTALKKAQWYLNREIQRSENTN